MIPEYGLRQPRCRGSLARRGYTPYVPMNIQADSVPAPIGPYRGNDGKAIGPHVDEPRGVRLKTIHSARAIGRPTATDDVTHTLSGSRRTRGEQPQSEDSNSNQSDNPPPTVHVPLLLKKKASRILRRRHGYAQWPRAEAVQTTARRMPKGGRRNNFNLCDRYAPCHVPLDGSPIPRRDEPPVKTKGYADSKPTLRVRLCPVLRTRRRVLWMRIAS